jgi:hypothetical protein
MRKHVDLGTFDGRLLDGLTFCRKAYALFDQIRQTPSGIENLRLHKTKTDKRLIEELLPISQYVQNRYCEGHRLKIRWHSGSQPYDAVLFSSGRLVEVGLLPQRSVLEVTTAVHQQAHLVRELVNRGEVAFGVKGVSRDKKSKKVISKPHVHHEGEIANDLADQIVERLLEKGQKSYAPETILLINCVTNTLTHEPEWQWAIQEARKAQLHSGFREVVLLDRRYARIVSL